MSDKEIKILYNNMDEILKDFKDINDLRKNYSGELIIMSRKDYIALGGDLSEFSNGIRTDVDENTPIVRCVNCGGEIVDEYWSGTERGFVDNDGDFNSMSRSDEEHMYYCCSCCGEELGSFGDGSAIQY